MLYPTYHEYATEAEHVLPLVADRLAMAVLTVGHRAFADLEMEAACKFLMAETTWWVDKNRLARLKQQLGLSKWATPTTGMVAIDVFLELYDEVYIHGFDFDADGNQPMHYFDEDETVWELVTDRLGHMFHGINQDKAHLAKLVKAGRCKFLPGAKDKVYAIIPARSGSTAVKNKNIRDMGGKPLMAWQITNAVESKLVNRTFVSTDSEQYRKIAKEHGAEVPFLRPPGISGSRSTDLEFLQHFLQWLTENNQEHPDYIVQLRPTAPMTTSKQVDEAVSLMLQHELYGYDALRSVTLYDHEAYNSYWIHDDDTTLKPLISHPVKDPLAPGSPVPYVELPSEPQSVARQILPKIYWHNAYIDIMRPSTILSTENPSCLGKKCLAYVMDPSNNADIDTQEQWNDVEARKLEQLRQDGLLPASYEEPAKQPL